MKKVMLFFAVAALAIGVNAQGDSKPAAKPADKTTAKPAAKPADKNAKPAPKSTAKPAAKSSTTTPASSTTK